MTQENAQLVVNGSTPLDEAALHPVGGVKLAALHCGGGDGAATNCCMRGEHRHMRLTLDKDGETALSMEATRGCSVHAPVPVLLLLLLLLPADCVMIDSVVDAPSQLRVRNKFMPCIASVVLSEEPNMVVRARSCARRHDTRASTPTKHECARELAAFR
eukprot:CAMPEP_0174701578 /NCGR_PEP_ID=MMETSP1094-20130205/6171_1 /TAXON_ID=156173 /ORGANISM="Chrysochromulina brevifilum, Strain UTEX LB 985" /LENGTH=158 /DNA_ID=CAMNT_0015899247 /DNA_START=156 /DNA_END=630 /DNA_ORIENTATION=-